ncbi:MAG: hypothetical protein KY464_10855 [Gemmatimonadetes bacterium]|nr:hypothetical protein [Gemmatimonadota bacterium]
MATRRYLLTAAILLTLPSCGGEQEATPDASAAPGASTSPAGDVGTAGSDATAAPVAGDSSATAGSHP